MFSQGILQKLILNDPNPWWHRLTSGMVGVYVWFLLTPLGALAAGRGDSHGPETVFVKCLQGGNVLTGAGLLALFPTSNFGGGNCRPSRV
jgi:hypothetical protein